MHWNDSKLSAKTFVVVVVVVVVVAVVVAVNVVVVASKTVARGLFTASKSSVTQLKKRRRRRLSARPLDTLIFRTRWIYFNLKGILQQINSKLCHLGGGRIN